MTRPITRSALASLALIAATASITPAVAYDRVDERQARQDARIHNGVRNGSITRQEAHDLGAEQARIREFERRARADGRLDGRERTILERAQDNASRHIRQEATDRDGRGNRSWYRRWW